MNKKQMLLHLVNNMDVWPNGRVPIDETIVDLLDTNWEWKPNGLITWILLNVSSGSSIREIEYDLKKQLIPILISKHSTREEVLIWSINNINVWPSKVIVNGKTLPLSALVAPEHWDWNQNNSNTPTLRNSLTGRLITKDDWSSALKERNQTVVNFKKAIDDIKKAKLDGVSSMVTDLKTFDEFCSSIPELAENCNSNGNLSCYEGVKILALPLEIIVLFDFLTSNNNIEMFQKLIDEKVPNDNLDAATIIKALVDLDE